MKSEVQQESVAKFNGLKPAKQLMLRIMGPEHIAVYQDLIVESVLACLPVDAVRDSTSKPNIRGAIIDGRLQVWGMLGLLEGEDKHRPVGYGTTMLREDALLNNRQLMIYSLYAYQNLSFDAYMDFWETLVLYAKHEKLGRISLVTENNARILEMARAVGMDTNTIYAFKDIEQGV